MTDLAFESSVNSDSIQTSIGLEFALSQFESSVNSDSIQTETDWTINLIKNIRVCKKLCVNL